MRLSSSRAAALAAAALATLNAGSLFAAPFGMQSVVVFTVDTAPAGGTGANTGRIYLREYALNLAGSPSASLAQSILMPDTAATSGNRALTVQVSASAEGGLNLSADRQYLVLGGYNTTAGQPGAGSGPTERVFGRVDMDGNVDTTTAYAYTSTFTAPRSVASLDGSQFWVATANSGVKYVTYQGSTVTDIAGTNGRRIDVYNAQLYISAQTTTAAPNGPLAGVGTVGTGTPTSGPATVAKLPGMPGSSPAPSPNPSAYDFFFADDNTLYVADDNATISTGGLQKWVFDGTNWVKQFTIGTASMRGLTGTVDDLGNVYLFTTTNYTSTGGNILYAYTDTLSNTLAAGVSAPVALATAESGIQFRGVEFVSVPEPAGLGLALVGAAALAARRRRA